MEKKLIFNFDKQKIYIIGITGTVLLFHFSFLKLLNFNQYIPKVSTASPLEVFFIGAAANKVKNSVNSNKNILSHSTNIKQPIKIQPISKVPQKVITPPVQASNKILSTSNENKINYTTTINNINAAPIEKPVNTNSPPIDKPKFVQNDNIYNNIEVNNANKISMPSSPNIINNQNIDNEGSNASINQEATYQGGLPAYPENARDNEIEGTVLLKILISAEGRAKIVHLVKSSENLELDNAALQHVQNKGNKFKPVIKNGKAVETWKTLPIQFKLGEF